MATIDSSSPVIGPATPTQPKTTAPKANDAMGKDQFLQLLVAQMKNQDPLNPMDGSQMAAQLAQFSSVEQLTQINETLSTQNSGQTGLATLLADNGALSAVGKQAVVTADAVDVTKGVPSSVLADIPSGARSATLHVYDESGKEVATQDLGAVSAGRATFALSGSTKQLTAGTYRFAVSTDNGSGTSADATTYVTGRIDGVRFSAKGPVVTIGGVAVPFMSVTELTS
jgi:flagellar basal-body rod modification protein FlgD